MVLSNGFPNRSLWFMSYDSYNLKETLGKPTLASKSSASTHSRGRCWRIASYDSFDFIYFHWTSLGHFSRFWDTFCSIQLISVFTPLYGRLILGQPIKFSQWQFHEENAKRSWVDSVPVPLTFWLFWPLKTFSSSALLMLFLSESTSLSSCTASWLILD